MTRYHAHRRGPDRHLRLLLTGAVEMAVFVAFLGVGVFLIWMAGS